MNRLIVPLSIIVTFPSYPHLNPSTRPSIHPTMDVDSPQRSLSPPVQAPPKPSTATSSQSDPAPYLIRTFLKTASASFHPTRLFEDNKLPIQDEYQLYAYSDSTLSKSLFFLSPTHQQASQSKTILTMIGFFLALSYLSLPLCVCTFDPLLALVAPYDRLPSSPSTPSSSTLR